MRELRGRDEKRLSELQWRAVAASEKKVVFPQSWRGVVMARLSLGIVCGLVYGVLSAASMIPLSFPDKRAALLGAFLNRFSIGFVLGAVNLPWPGWVSGVVIGVLLSLADAVITKAYAPIIILGAIGGSVIGMIVDKFGK
ncbi:MAG: hypothetical protein LAO78_07065 [Acidobacteriia bacterium]|nr:hypothetical protein [Terriglobia bacterium]